MSKDTKTLLKEIREDIKAEKFQEAINKGNTLLEVDPRSYMCHLLMGAAYQNISKADATKHLRLAIDNCGSNPPTIALQGLANCAPTEELPGIYKELLRLMPDKYSKFYEKLFKIAEHRSLTKECFNLFCIEVAGVPENSERRSIILSYLAKLWILYDIEVNRQNEDLYKSALETTILSSDNQENSKLITNAYKRYLKLLYNRMEYEKCLKYACNVLCFYPDAVYALEWICKIYCEHYTSQEASKYLSALNNPIQQYAKSLLDLNSNSGLGMLVNAIDFYVAEQYLEAHDLLKTVQSVQPNYKVSVELLARVEMTLGAYELALPYWQVLDKTESIEYAICLSHSAQESQLWHGIKLLENMEQTSDVIATLARCYYALQEFEKLQTLKLDIRSQAEFIIMEPKEGIDLLKTSIDVESFETLFLLGKLCMKDGDYQSALNYMLKATRLKSYHSLCFYHLGCIYYATRDIVRARKCLEKCININPACFDAVYNLSAIYQELKEEDLNMTLLLNALSYMKFENSQRIHYKLGLHYLCANKWDDAIHSFRAAIKYDIKCIIYWESLGDAYAARGSYHSAIRVFQKIREMDPSNIYANLQLALLKTTLRMYPEAIIEFEHLLREHPSYLPGLKGAAEAHLGLAHDMKLDHRYRCCKTHLQFALNYLQDAFLLQNQKEMVWLWRLTGSVFMKAALMPNSLANLEVSGKLVECDAESIVVLQRNELLSLSSRFYSCAVKIKSNTFLWYELALAYYTASKYNMPNDAQMQLELAAKACKIAIKLQNDRWQNWNLLGVINMQKEHGNFQFAQHCFIQALIIDRKSYTTWTNLGVLYLHLSEIKLANQAFKRAQQSSPIYGKAWIGQAMIAEAISEDEEALDLFRHCLQFEYNSESAIGYAHWICKELSNENKTHNHQYRHDIESMFADVVALDAINWYTANEEDESSVAGLSFQAFLDIRQKLYRPAVQSYTIAIKNASPGSERDKMLTNLGYLYLKLNEPNEAVNVFHMVGEATFKPIIGLAIAYFRSEQHQESYMVFSSVLKSLGGTDDHKAACIIVAMSAMLYASQGQEDTKAMLMQCLPLKDAPIQGVYSAFALGILHHDNELADHLVAVLRRNESYEKYCVDIAYLIGQYYLVNHKKQAGLNYILSRVHIFPYSTNLRCVLADYLHDNFLNEHRYNFPTCQIALSAIDLSHRDDKKKNDCEKDAQCLLIASRALASIDSVRAKKLLQRAVHLNPQNQQAWSVLMAK